MQYKSYLLVNALLVPLAGAIRLLFIPIQDSERLKIMALNFSIFPFFCFLSAWVHFDKSDPSFQFVVQAPWLPILDITFSIGVDGLSLFFLLLTTLLIPICLLAAWESVHSSLREFLICFLILEFFLIGSFCALDVLLFYVFFESVLIPMFLVIGIWGSRERKILAAYYFFFYTFAGSVLMLLAIVYILASYGTTNYEVLVSATFSSGEQKFLWFAFFLAFASKVPMMPAHLWLPEAHVEAPTAGSVLLAGVLLKLGTYGFMRFSLPLFPQASVYFTPIVYAISLIGIVYSSLTAIRQSDLKRIIAYSSIAHMNLVVLGIFSFTSIGLEGALLQSLSHGFVASALFLAVGIVYDRHRTRIVQYYGGLASVMPIYSFLFLFFTMANISLPGTSSFVGELLIFLGSFRVNTTVTFIGATSIVIGGAYSLWLFNRVSYGNLKVQHADTFIDLSPRELMSFLPLVPGTLLVGIRPDIILSTIHMSVNNLTELLNF